MHRQHTTKTDKAMRMQFSCIISGCPEGARKWHIPIFALLYIVKSSGFQLESAAQTVEKLSQPKDSEGKIIGKKTVRVVFPV